MVALPRADEQRARALDRLHRLRSYPDATVQRTALEVEEDVAAIPTGLNGYLAAMAPEGTTLNRMELSLKVFFLDAGQHTGSYVFRRPVKVRVTQDGEYYLGFSPAFLVHGTGDTPEDALQAFFVEWANRYAALRALEREDRLGEPLRRELADIRRRLKHPDPAPLGSSSQTE